LRNCHTYSNTYVYTNPHSNGDSYTYCYTYTDTNRYTDRYPYTYSYIYWSNCYTYSKSGCVDHWSHLYRLEMDSASK